MIEREKGKTLSFNPLLLAIPGPEICFYTVIDNDWNLNWADFDSEFVELQ